MICDPSFCGFSSSIRLRDDTDVMQPHCRNPGACFQIKLRATQLSVRAALRAALARYARQMTEDEAGLMEIVLAELMNNIVKHAYAAGDPGEIQLRIQQRRGMLACRVEDQGAEMPDGVLPARNAPRFAADSHYMDVPEGGFGWCLIHDLSQNLSYVRIGDTNRVDFSLPLSGS